MHNLQVQEFKSNLYNGAYAGKSGVHSNFSTSDQKIKQRFEASPLLNGIIPTTQKAGIESISSVLKSIETSLINRANCRKPWFRSETLPSSFISILDNLRITCFSRKAKLLEIALKSPTFKAIYEKANAAAPYSEKNKPSIWSVELVSQEVAEFGAMCCSDVRVIAIASGLSDHEFLSALLFELTNAIQTPKFRELDRKVLEDSITCEEFVRKTEWIEFKGTLLHARLMPQIITEIYGVNHKLSDEALFTLNEYQFNLRCVECIQKIYNCTIKEAEKIHFKDICITHQNSPHFEACKNDYFSMKNDIEEIKEINEKRGTYNQEVCDYNIAIEGRYDRKALPLSLFLKIDGDLEELSEKIKEYNQIIKNNNQKVKAYNREIEEYNQRQENQLEKE